MSILLPVVLFFSWLVFVFVPAGQLAIEDEQNGVPANKRRGTSIFPGFPVMPLIFWGTAWLIDLVVAPGSRIILVLHVILLIVSVIVIIRDVVRFRRIRREEDTCA